MKILLIMLIYVSILATGQEDSLILKESNSTGEKKLEAIADLIEFYNAKNDSAKTVKYTDKLITRLTAIANPVLETKYLKLIVIKLIKFKQTDKLFPIGQKLLGNILSGDDKEFAKYYKSITDYFYFSGYYNKNIALAKSLSTYKKKEIKREVVFLRTIGQNYIQIGELDSAYNYARLNISLREKIKDTNGLGHSYNVMGVLLWKRGKLFEAYKYYTKSEEYCGLSKDTATHILVLNNLALIFQRLKYYDNAIEYIKKSIELAKEKKDNFGLGYGYKRMADLYLETKEFDLVKNYLDKAHEALKRTNRIKIIIDLYYSYGKLYLAENKLEKALEAFNKAGYGHNEPVDKFTWALILTRKSEVQFELNNIEQSLKDAEAALKIAQEKKYNVIIRDNYFNLYKAHNKLNESQKALEYLERYNLLKENILNENIINSINENSIRQSVHKSREIQKSLEKENNLQKTIIAKTERLKVFYFAIFVIILIALIFIGWQLTKERKLHKTITEKNDNLLKLNGELNETNTELALANDTKSKLFSIIAHDLKNPFFSIYGFASLINEYATKKKDPELTSYSETLVQSSSKLVEMIDNLTKWAKIQQSILKPNLTSFKFSEEIDKIVEQVHSAIKLKEIDLIINLNNDAFVYADKEMTNTIIRNLVSNAIKFTPKKGLITIICESKLDFVRFSIKDSGKGLTDQMVDVILTNKPITSTEGTESEKGTGLGLTICKDFIKGNKGKFNVFGNYGTGAEFEVLLPKGN